MSTLHDIYYETNVKNLSVNLILKFIGIIFICACKRCAFVFELKQTWRFYRSDADSSYPRKQRWPCILVSSKWLSYFQHIYLYLIGRDIFHESEYINVATTTAGGSKQSMCIGDPLRRFAATSRYHESSKWNWCCAYRRCYVKSGAISILKITIKRWCTCLPIPWIVNK